MYNLTEFIAQSVDTLLKAGANVGAIDEFANVSPPSPPPPPPQLWLQTRRHRASRRSRRSRCCADSRRRRRRGSPVAARAVPR